MTNKNANVNIIDELDKILAQSDNSSKFFRFNAEELKGKIVAIKNIKTTNKKTSLGSEIYELDVYHDDIKQFKRHLATFPSYMRTRIFNMRTNGLKDSDVILIKYLGKKESKKFKNKLYDDFFIQTLEDAKSSIE